MPQHSKENILAGRNAVDAYRQAHAQLHSKPWHKGIPEEHTPLLVGLVDALEKQGFTSAHTDFEPKKTEVLGKFFDASEELNMQELGFASREDFEVKATEADREAVKGMWK